VLCNTLSRSHAGPAACAPRALVNPKGIFQAHAQFLSVFVLTILIGVTGVKPSVGQSSTAAFAVQLNAAVQENPPTIVLTWAANPFTQSVSLYKRPLAGATNFAAGWQPLTTVGASVTSFTDTQVAPGVVYEYKAVSSVLGYSDPVTGMIAAGIRIPLAETRGTVILVVDATKALDLSTELTRLAQDLVGDGWTVIRHDVHPSDSPADVKALIQADYNADPANVRSVFLFGAVPVPYSGPVDPDAHPEHYVPWPADVYYGVMHGSWITGKTITGFPDYFSNTSTPAEADLEVGRVDLSNMRVFAPKSETDLLRQYLDKDHNFRHGLVTAQRRGLLTDHFNFYGFLGVEDFSASAYSAFSSLFGAANVNDRAWISPATSDMNYDLTFPTLQHNAYLWSCIDSGGLSSFNGVYYTGASVDWASRDPMTVFTTSFGSYFGDWNHQDSFLRAPLADASMTLSNSWSGRPRQYYQRTAMGLTLGDSMRISQNTRRETWTALMGDPTLRVLVVPPAANLTAAVTGQGVVLRWSASPDPAVQGYNVYRASAAAGPYARLNGQPMNALTYTDATAAVGANWYMVRAVKLDTSASGTFTNASQGIFQAVTVSGTGPSISLASPAANSVLSVPAGSTTAVTLSACASSPSGAIRKVEFFVNDNKVGESAVASTALAAAIGSSQPAYNLSWTSSGPGAFRLTATATDAAGNQTTSEAVTFSVRSLQPPQVSATLTTGSSLLPGGTFTVNAVAVTPTPSDQVVRVQLLANGNLASELKTSDLPYNFNWSNAQEQAQQPYPYALTFTSGAAAVYQLVAHAITKLGLTADSAPISVTVSKSSPPPAIAITSPVNGALILAGAAAPVTVNVTSPIANNPAVKVDLFANAARMDTSATAPFTTTFRASVPGTYVLTAAATDTLGNTAVSDAVTVTVTSGIDGLRVNAGGSSVGNFASDGFYSGGTSYTDSHAVDVSGVNTPAPSAAYQSMRFATGQFSYTFSSLTAGASYKLRLHFQEAGWNAAGKRLFDVSANGSSLLAGFDVFAAAGGMYKAVIKEFTVPADSSGVVILTFSGTPGAVDPTPFVCALELLPTLSAVGQAPLTPTGLSATASASQVSLAWSAVAGATSYNVYRATTPSGEGAAPYRSNVTAASFVDAAVSSGTTYYYKVSAANANGESPQSSEVTGAASQTIYQINAAGDAVGTFSADAYFVGGSTWSTTESVDTKLASNPAPMAAYQSLRYAAKSFSYVIPKLTPGGTYKVRLHFAEAAWKSAGKRLFGVTCNGRALLSHFDVYSAARGAFKAVVEQFTVTADSGGKLNLVFTGTPGATDPTPFVCGLEVSN
jgi:hypothetical protein